MLRLLQSSVARRQVLFEPGTDAWRLVDDEGDALPGIELESWAERWLVATREPRLPPPLHDWLAASRRTVYQKNLDQQQKDPPRHLCGPPQDTPFLVHEQHVAFEVSFQAGYSQGLFLDQRDNRRQVRSLLRPGQTLLNTFAYTGAFSVAAALAGAQTTTLDLAQPPLDWARRNFSHNALDPADHHFCKGDAFQWLRRFAKQGRRFDAVILDPPTFSRDAKGRVFRLEDDATELAALALDCLAPDGWILFSTNCRKLPLTAFERKVRAASPRPLHLDHSPMPPDFPGPPYLKSLWIRR
jgi:23S rRNA (cytosine1962-C5)-methyltransferase